LTIPMTTPTGSATARRRFGNRLTNPGPGFRHDGRPVAAV
jgi:hypothetical protein